MKTLEVTADQYAFIQALREEISDQVVGKYGHVRDRDAVQFLIDSLDGSVDPDVEVDLSAADLSGTDAVSFEEEASAAVDDSRRTDEPDVDADPGEEGAPGGEAGDDDMLDRMMSLLETHDDKWTESPAEEYRYRVTLPDGATEDVQTKDDVRALLFKNY